MRYSTLTSWAQLLWETLQDEGIEPRSVFAQAGLNPALLGDGNARYPTDQMHQLWRLSEQAHGNDLLGLQAGQLWHSTTFNALGFAWLASDTLHDALGRLVRYARLISNGLQVTIEQRQNLYLLSFDADLTPQRSANLAAVAAVITMCRALLGPSFSPVAIHLKHRYHDPANAIGQFFGCPIQPGALHSTIALDAQQAHIRLPGANAQLALLNEQVALENLNRLVLDNLPARVAERMLKHLPSGDISAAIIAQDLAMSSRSLQRKLQAEGTTFNDLLERVRQQLARDYLPQSQLALSEISYLLGYADQANFNRAFKRWFNTTPRQYRHQALARANAG